MKRSTLTFLLSVAAMGLAASASADLLYTFDTGAGIDSTEAVPEAGGTFSGNYVWDSTYQAVQHNVTGSNQGGWTLGGSDNMRMNWNWPSQSTMWNLDDSYGANGVVSFDLILNDNSWNWAVGGAGSYLQFNIAGNSGGANGYTQVGLAGNFSVFQNGTYHYAFTFSQLGWGEGSANDGYFQLFFGANSATQDGIGFYIDNISVTPEPATFALMGLGAAAMLIFRRK